MFNSEVQFGHAGACANQVKETSVAKNMALKKSGAHVPDSFDQLHQVIRSFNVTMLILYLVISNMSTFILYYVLK